MPIKVSSPPTQAFDYIVCGGGPAGCALASRLAKGSDATVLLIEAGKHNELLESTKMTGGWVSLVGTPEDWQIPSTPEKNLNGRQLRLIRGKFLGGSSGLNGTLCVRGTKQDYDDWQIKGWSGEEMWRYMIEAENFHPKEWFQHDPSNHGHSGLLHTEPHDPAPITNLLLESMASRGLPYHPDMFSIGNTPNGCGHAVRTVHKGIRSTAADLIDGAGDNLWVWTESIVDKVNLEKDDSGALQAISVDVVYLEAPYTIRANKEIIISGGAYCSPLILLRSGIGPKSEIESFGIESKVDLPGVGKNLIDHLIVPITYEISKPGLTTDILFRSPNGYETEYTTWKNTRTGFLATYPFGAFAYARLDSRLQDSELWQRADRHDGRDPMGLTPSQPNMEIFTTESFSGFGFPEDGTLVKPLFTAWVELFNQKSRGTVRLGTKDPSTTPIVDVNFIDDPLDLLVISEACAFTNEVITQGAGTKDIIAGPWPPSSGHTAFKTREDWVPFVRKAGTTCFHPAGTCKMGPTSDPMTVVDERLRVRGVKGLRVADASIMPLLNNGHPQLPIYAIGMKCADMLKEDN